MPTALHPHFPLLKGRVHECCGAGAWAFAAIACGQSNGAVLCVREAWQPEQINPLGMVAFCDPAKVLIATGKDQNEVLAVSEEALRSGALTMVVIELSKPLSLLAGRRLQLAAKTGKSTGLALIPDGMGSNAAETRWRCDPVFENSVFGIQDSTLSRWSLIKNKSGTLRDWTVCWDVETHRVIVVSTAGK